MAGRWRRRASAAPRRAGEPRNVVFVLVAAVIMFAFVLPATRAGRPFRRVQVIALVFAVLAMAGATWNAIITFSP